MTLRAARLRTLHQAIRIPPPGSAQPMLALSRQVLDSLFRFGNTASQPKPVPGQASVGALAVPFGRVAPIGRLDRGPTAQEAQAWLSGGFPPVAGALRIWGEATETPFQQVSCEIEDAQPVRHSLFHRAGPLQAESLTRFASRPGGEFPLCFGRQAKPASGDAIAEGSHQHLCVFPGDLFDGPSACAGDVVPRRFNPPARKL